MNTDSLPSRSHDEQAPEAPVRLNLNLVLLVEPEQLLPERRFRSHQSVDGIMPVTAQNETRGLVVVEKADDDAVADLDTSVWLLPRCLLGCICLAHPNCRSCVGNTLFSIALGTAVLRRRMDAVRIEHCEKIGHAAVGVNGEARRPTPPEPPTYPFEHALPRHVVGPALRAVVLIPIALNGEAPVGCSFHHQVDLVTQRADLGRDAVSAFEQSVEDSALEVRVA